MCKGIELDEQQVYLHWFQDPGNQTDFHIWTSEVMGA